MASNVTVWQTPPTPIVPADANNIGQIVAFASQLTKRDVQHIVKAFESQSYEMVSGFVLKRSLSALKKQLATLGMSFIGETLGRPDITENSVAAVTITDFEAVSLGR
jgi:hypothetical protein